MDARSPSSPLRLAVFDCDGTLVDSQRAIVSSMHAAFEGLGMDPPGADAVRRMVGLPLLDAVAQLAPRLDAAEHTALVEGYRSHFFGLRRTGAVHEPLYPGVDAALAALEADGWLLGVATGKSRAGLDATLRKHGLDGRFVTLQTADQCPGKPQPDMLLRAMDETGTRPDCTVMIGDTTYDILMARNAGVSAIGVSWGYHPVEELQGAGADAVVNGFAELPAVIDALVE